MVWFEMRFCFQIFLIIIIILRGARGARKGNKMYVSLVQQWTHLSSSHVDFSWVSQVYQRLKVASIYTALLSRLPALPDSSFGPLSSSHLSNPQPFPPPAPNPSGWYRRISLPFSILFFCHAPNLHMQGPSTFPLERQSPHGC